MLRDIKTQTHLKLGHKVTMRLMDKLVMRCTVSVTAWGECGVRMKVGGVLALNRISRWIKASHIGYLESILYEITRASHIGCIILYKMLI